MCLLKRVVLLTILTYLRIAIILANGLHSTFLCICKVIADIFQLPASHLLNGSPTRSSSTQNISHCSSPKVSTSVQTEEEPKQLENAGPKSSTDVIIYNLNSTQKLVITQGNSKSNICENCKVATDITAEKIENVTAPSVGSEDSNASYMSIESDVVDSKIESGCNSSSISSSCATSDGFTTQLICIEDTEVKTDITESDNKRVSFGNVDNTFVYSNDELNESFDFECLKEKDSDNISVKSDDKAASNQKTSSPFKKLSLNPQNLSINYINQSQKTENKDLGTRSNLEDWKNESFGSNFKRRLSLPVKLNTTNTADMNFKIAQTKLIEDALKNTSRHEKSMKEIKYQFPSEISLDSKNNDEYDKGVFSCSSYESLPVSDHIRNAFNNSAVLSLYNESLHSEDKPDFSCVDRLVEGFQAIKSNLSVLSSTMDKMPSTKTGNDDKSETQLFADINLNSNVTDMCNVLDRFVTSEVKLVPEKISDFSDKNVLMLKRNSDTDVLHGNADFKNNEQFEGNDCERICSTTFEYESFDNSSEKQGNQINTSEPILNEIKSTSSFKSLLFDEEEADNIENALLSLRDESKTNKSESCDNLQKVWQQSYLKIAFIDVSPTHETNHTSQNISETDSDDRYFDIDENPTPIEVDLGDETSKFAKNNNLLPLRKRWRENFGEFTQTEKKEPNGMFLSSNVQHADSDELTNICEITVFSFKNEGKINKPANLRKQQYKAFADEIAICELNDADENIFDTNFLEQQSTLSEENSSSGDSTDNSVVTVKDLNVADN